MNTTFDKKRILVTGGAGFLGSHLCEKLLKEGNFVICLDNLSSGFKENISIFESNNNFEFIELERHLSFLPSGGEVMMEASSYLSQTRFKDALFRNLLSSVHQKIVIIDTAPSWSVVSRNILMYVDYVIVPVVTDYLGFSGCDQIMAYIDEFKQSMLGQSKAEVLGIAITRSHPRTNLAQTITEGLQERWSDLLFKRVIEESVSIQEAPAFQQSIFDYRKGRTRGAEMYDQLCREIMRRIVQRQKDTT